VLRLDPVLVCLASRAFEGLTETHLRYNSIYGLVADVDTVQRQMLIEILRRCHLGARSSDDRLVTTNSGVTGLTLMIALFFAIYSGMRAAKGMIGRSRRAFRWQLICQRA
jgi:membrane protein